MHFLDIIVLVLIGFQAIVGATKGFFKTVFGFASIVISLLLAVTLATEVGAMLYGFSFGGPSIGENFTETIKTAFAEQGIGATPEGGYTAANVTVMLQEAGIPGIIATLLAGPVADVLAPSSGLSFIDVLPPLLSNILFTVIGFVLLFIIVWAVTGIIARIIRKAIDSAPLAKNIDSLLGLLLGALRGMISVWITLAMVSLVSFLPFVSDLIGATSVVKWLADNNLITSLLASGFDVQGIINEILANIKLV